MPSDAEITVILNRYEGLDPVPCTITIARGLSSSTNYHSWNVTFNGLTCPPVASLEETPSTYATLINQQAFYRYKVSVRAKWSSGTGMSVEDESNKYFNIDEQGDCHINPLWHWNYCTLECKCDAGEGDCDINAHCNTNYCAKDVGANYGQNPHMDVCEEPGGPCIDECTLGQTRCYDGTSYQECGNFDSDSCLEWSTPPSLCEHTSECGYGSCSSDKIASWYCSGDGNCLYYCVYDSDCETPVGKLRVNTDASTPLSDIILDDEISNLAVFRLSANNLEGLDLDQITLNIDNGQYIDTLYFYNGDNLIGLIPGSNSPTIYFSDGTLTIPADGHKEIIIKAKPLSIDNSSWTNNSPVKILLQPGSVQTTGLASGGAVTSSDYAASNVMYVFETRPVFSVNSGSPSGNLFPSSNTQVAIFDIEAGPEDITFRNFGSGGVLKIQVEAAVNDTSATSLNYILVTLKDGDGNVLGYDSVGIGATGSINSGTLVFDASKSWGSSGYRSTMNFTIPANSTKQLYVIADTREFEDDGDLIQIWLSDDSNSNIEWGIDENGYYNHGKIIFRSDIYAGVFVNPS